MMTVLKSFASAFLMYSRIPMPVVEWKEENKRYALCFFPLIGVVIGALIYLAFLGCDYLGLPGNFFGAVALCIPIIVTGGIHIDGFMDVNDAKACLGDKEKKLSVMKDSRVGAFAVIHICLYMILFFAAFTQLGDEEAVMCSGFIFVISRALSGLGAVTFKSATGMGSLTSFTKPAHKAVTIVTEILYVIVCTAAMMCINPYIGAGVTVVALLTFVYYRIFAYRTFGGITGDVAGYFLQLCELFCVLTVLITGAV